MAVVDEEKWGREKVRRACRWRRTGVRGAGDSSVYLHHGDDEERREHGQSHVQSPQPVRHEDDPRDEDPPDVWPLELVDDAAAGDLDEHRQALGVQHRLAAAVVCVSK